MDSDVETNTEILWHEWAHSVTLKNHLAVEESTLWESRVDLLWLNHEDGLVFKEVVDKQRVDSEVLETTLDNRLFEVAIET